MTRVLNATDVVNAQDRIRSIVDRTPVIRSPWLTELAGVPIWLKLENLQPCGSFKLRGAANRILSLTRHEQQQGIITCSGGNHGAAVAYIAELLHVPATVCVPETVDPVKLREIRRYGAEAVVAGHTFDDAVTISHDLETKRRLTYIHPFDDPDIIAGQGTIGLELRDQIPNLSCVVAAVSGGGLSGGIGLGLSDTPGIRVVGASAERASTMAASIEAGHPINLPYEETVAEVLTGGIGLDNKWSFNAVRKYVSQHVLVDDSHIRQAMRGLLERHRIVVEGGGAVPTAAILARLVGKSKKILLRGPTALVVSGGNTSVTGF